MDTFYKYSKYPSWTLFIFWTFKGKRKMSLARLTPHHPFIIISCMFRHLLWMQMLMALLTRSSSLSLSVGPPPSHEVHGNTHTLWDTLRIHGSCMHFFDRPIDTDQHPKWGYIIVYIYNLGIILNILDNWDIFGQTRQPLPQSSNLQFDLYHRLDFRHPFRIAPGKAKCWSC